jgi:hypothetical protein
MDWHDGTRSWFSIHFRHAAKSLLVFIVLRRALSTTSLAHPWSGLVCLISAGVSTWQNLYRSLVIRTLILWLGSKFSNWICYNPNNYYTLLRNLLSCKSSDPMFNGNSVAPIHQVRKTAILVRLITKRCKGKAIPLTPCRRQGGKEYRS